MNLDEFEELAFRRASVRDYRPDPVSRDLLERLLRVTQRTPSTYNLQPVHYYVVRQQQLKEAMLEQWSLRKNYWRWPMAWRRLVEEGA